VRSTIPATERADFYMAFRYRVLEVSKHRISVEASGLERNLLLDRWLPEENRRSTQLLMGQCSKNVGSRDHRSQRFVRDVRIDFGCGDGRVSKQSLNIPNIDAGLD
jgi:hypothetical protein